MPEVNTTKIINNLINLIATRKKGLIFANIQELDIAGHSQNVNESIKIKTNSSLEEITRIIENFYFD